MRKAASTCPKITFYQARGSFQLVEELCNTNPRVKNSVAWGMRHVVLKPNKALERPGHNA